MPKFWAKDYLSEALQEQRSVVERMSLAPPTHIEIVDCYAHKGEVDNIHCTMPWILYADFNLHSHMPPALLLEPLHSDLQTLAVPGGSGGGISAEGHFGGLISGAGGLKQCLEKYRSEESGSESLFSDDEEGAPSFGLTQEIDSAVDRVMSSLSGGGGRGHCGRSWEDFPAENLLGWEKNTTPEVAELYLEQQECLPHLTSLLCSLPTVSDLVARLKPKLISDPLVNPSTGGPYTYTDICRSDFELWEAESPPKKAPVITDPILAARQLDSFLREDTDGGATGGDPVLELHMASPITESLLEQSSPTDTGLMPPLPELPSPVVDEGDTEDSLKPGEELRELASEVQEEADRRQLHFTSPEAQPPKPASSTSTTDFLKLNNADVSRDSEDSGIGHAVLESPCVPFFSSPSLFSSSSLPAHLSRLQALPVSPNSPHKLGLLSPLSEDRLLTHIQEDCRNFDSVLALRLPYTGPGSYLDATMKSYRPLDLVEACCDVRPINLTGDSELALPWDPLASSYHLMTTVQRALVCLPCPISRDSTSEARDAAEKCFEEFAADATLGGDDVEESLIGIVEGDVPSIHSAPVGYITTRQMVAPSSRPATDATRPGPILKSNGQRRQIEQLQHIDSASPLELFIMMRTGKLSPEIAKTTDTNSRNEVNGLENNTDLEDPMETKETWATSPTIQDVNLNKEHQLVLGKVAHYGTPIMDDLQTHGLPVGRDTLLTSLDPDDVKFFLKQQQKCLADSQGSKEESVLLQSCKLAASLYVLVSLADGIIHINLATGLRRFAFLNEKYEELIGSGLDAAKQDLADLQLRVQNMPHPKLHSLVSTVDNWKTNRKNTQEKAVVVVGKDFSTVSGDILDFLKSISDLKSCVFSFTCESPGNPLYLETLEERLQYYDCLVVPLTSIVTSFPWEKVGLLVEYHSLGERTLFPDGRLPPSLHLTQWLVLNTVREVSSTSLAKSGSALSAMAFQYTLIASENITSSPKLLQLLESRFNIVLISREYEPLKKKIGLNFSHADLIVDQCTGVLVHPLSQLASDAGVHQVSTRAAALSLQYQRLWILLYAESKENYPYGGSVPLNLARLHASVAHYSLQEDDYLVRLLCVSDLQEAAQLVRTISEDTRKQNEGVDDQDWSDREWIADDMELHERFLLGFPCLNSFSAQLLLRRYSLRQLLMLSLPQLQELFPWLPLKVAKFFTQMCHFCFQTNLPPPPTSAATGAAGGGEASSHWLVSEDISGYNELPTTSVTLDDSLQDMEDSYSPDAVNRDTELGHSEQLLPLSSNRTSALQSSGENGDVPGSLTATADWSTSTAQSAYSHSAGSEAVVSFNFNPFPASPSPHRLQDRELRYDLATDTLSLTQTGHSTKNTGFFTPASKSPSPPPRISLFEPQASLKDSSLGDGGAQGSTSVAKLSDHHFVVPENLYKEYYGNDPMPPRLLTSGMVRRTPHRQPIKSLDLDVGPSSPQGREKLPRLQANDRGAALNNGTGSKEVAVGSGQGVLDGVFDRPGRWAKGVEELMEFHSRQRLPERENLARAPLFSNTSTTNTGNQRFRQKRPLPSSPIFDCQVPTQTISPQSGGESSFFPSPNISIGSVKLSPMRKRRLVYKKLPSSSDGQTKLAFE